MPCFYFFGRKGTAADKIDEQVPMEVRRKRSAHLRRLSSFKKMEFYNKQVGEDRIVLFENPKNGTLPGYTSNYVRVFMENTESELANQFVQGKD